MAPLQYHLVDVFTARPFAGNQLAVFTDGRGISAEAMQSIARELNLSETSFVLPPSDPTNHFHVRIFTPGTELPMAGHPTVGTAYVLARERLIEPGGAETQVRFEEQVGVIPVSLRFEGGAPATITMTQPLPTFGAAFEDREALAAMLSLEPECVRDDLPAQVVSCGVPFLYVPLRDLESVRRARLRLDEWERALSGFETDSVFIFSEEVEHPGSTVHSRMFAPGLGVHEDPATGAASGPLGAYLVRYGLVQAEPIARIVSEQGIELGRPSFIRVAIEKRGGEFTAVRVGGECVYVGRGELHVG